MYSIDYNDMESIGLQDMIGKVVREKPIAIDLYEPTEEHAIFKTSKNVIFVPITDVIKDDSDPKLNFFNMSNKKGFNKEDIRMHIIKYINYFIEYYDTDNELLTYYSRIKLMTDYDRFYNEAAFMHDLTNYIMSQSICHKITQLVNDNYNLSMSYTNANNAALQYTDYHGKILMGMSVMMDILIPLITHFTSTRDLNVNQFTLEVFNKVLNLSPGPDIYAKLDETVSTNVNKGKSQHSTIWEKQDIRGITSTTHSNYCLDTIILNIMPKYTFDQNIISFNYTSINKNTHFQITGIQYEFSFASFSSSNRDEDFNSDFDKRLISIILIIVHRIRNGACECF